MKLRDSGSTCASNTAMPALLRKLSGANATRIRPASAADPNAAATVSSEDPDR